MRRVRGLRVRGIRSSSSGIRSMVRRWGQWGGGRGWTTVGGLEGKRCVFVTAGASAPERLVETLIERLKRDYGGEVEERTLVEEDIQFELPKTLRKLAVMK